MSKKKKSWFKRYIKRPFRRFLKLIKKYKKNDQEM